MNTDQYSIFGAEEIPLYRKLRPQNWDDYHDFSGITDLKKQFAKKPFSLLLYGPPGCGKTTTLQLLASASSLPLVSLSSTETTLEEIRKLLKKHTSGFLLFMDEIHRFSKSRQDIFLRPMEEGQIVLLAATTESPWYYLTKPLLSRMRVKEIVAPKLEQYKKIIEQIWQSQESQKPNEHLWNLAVEQTWPDFRKTFLTLEYIEKYLNKNFSQEEATNKLQEFLQENRQLSANFASLQYDNLSAFIKSMRGSDANATVLYLANLLNAGVEPALLARRITVFASEDVGLADSQALVIANSALQAVEKIGMPEARIILSQAAIYMATAPKSNSAYKAINEALRFVKDKNISPPGNIVNHSVEIKNYKYPHQYGGYVKQMYWPADVPKQEFYIPCENKFGENLENIRTKKLSQLHKEENTRKEE